MNAIPNGKFKIVTCRVLKDNYEEIDYNIFANINFYNKDIKFEVCIYNYCGCIYDEFLFEKNNIDDCIKEIENILNEYHKENTINIEWLSIQID